MKATVVIVKDNADDVDIFFGGSKAPSQPSGQQQFPVLVKYLPRGSILVMSRYELYSTCNDDVSCS